MDVYYVHKINLLKETSNFPNLLIYSSLYNLPATDILFTEKSFRPYLLFLPYRARYENLANENSVSSINLSLKSDSGHRINFLS